MTQVQGTLTRPDGSPAVGSSVRFTLVGATRAFVSADDETVLATQAPVAVDEFGAYTIDLPGNSALNPAGTRWRREIIGATDVGRVRDDLLVPATGGPYFEEDILAESLDPLPTPGAVTELDYSEIVTDNPALAINLLGIASVPNLTVTVPDMPEVCYILGNVGVSHSAADATVALAVGPTGLGTGDINSALGAGWVQLNAAGSPGTVPLRARIPAHSPGDFQLYANGTSGDVTVRGLPYAPASLAAWRMPVA